jgi:enoyl-CoA hydratase/carnithine racemase
VDGIRPTVSYETISYDVEGPVATITLDRPDTLNAIDAAMREDLAAAVEDVAVDDDVRVVVVTGAGRAFSSGADHGLLREMTANPGPRFRWEYRRLHRVFDDMEQLEKPVIAAANGVCVGGGFELALYCDFVLAAESAVFGFPEDTIGLIPASGAPTKLAKEVGTFQAKELILTATDRDHMVPAEEMHERFGIVARVFDDDSFDEETRAFAERLAETAPLATGLAKTVIDGAPETSFVTGRRFERTSQSSLIQSEDHAEGMDAFAEKREPEFEGR